MRVAEIFYSIQGEGMLVGMPSVFVRTSGCNLRCRWCDTKYASWNPEGENVGLEEILAEVHRHPASHVVLTGGEPMVAKEIHELAAALHTAGKHITIETAGTVPPEGIPCDLASLSPKLSNSTPASGEISEAWIEQHDSRRTQPDVLAAWMENYAYQLKFVVSDDGDMEEIEALLEAVESGVPADRVLLMPEGTEPDTLRSRTEWVVGLCQEKGYRFCPRLHIELFGNTRGT
ncbi:MAG: 7-carboxy-7-deazaguanine synthase QueE [Verrucomicrobiota bacterium]